MTKKRVEGNRQQNSSMAPLDAVMAVAAAETSRAIRLANELAEARAEAEKLRDEVLRLREDHDFEYMAAEVARADNARLREALKTERAS